MAGLDRIKSSSIGRAGFTIVELLIVVVVIGVLAAIVIVAYNGITASANDAAVESDLANMAKKIELFKVQNGAYPTNSAELVAADMKATKSVYMPDRNNLYYCRTDDLTSYAIGAESITGSDYFLVNGSVSPSGGVSGAATCAQLDPAASTWVSTGQSSTNVWQSWTE